MKSAKSLPALRERGMTLVEIMMVMGIIGITLTFGVPSMVNMVDDMRLTSVANDYLGFLNVARSEAGKRGARITVCATSNYTSCSATSSTDWAVGAVAFIDANSDGVVQSTETVVRVLDAQPTGLTITASTTTGGANPGRFIYKPSGASDSARKFCIRKAARTGRDLSVSVQGRATVLTATAAACP